MPTSALRSHDPIYCPPADHYRYQRSMVEDASATRGRSVHIYLGQIVPRSGGPPCTQGAARKGGRRITWRTPEGSRASSRTLGTIRGWRQLYFCPEKHSSASRRRLESNRSWSGSVQVGNVHIFSTPVGTEAFIHACIFGTTSASSPGFQASSSDGSSVILRRVRQRQVDGPTYYTDEKMKWVQHLGDQAFLPLRQTGGKWPWQRPSLTVLISTVPRQPRCSPHPTPVLSGTAVPAAAAATTPADASPSPHSSEPLHRRRSSDRTSSVATTPTTTEMPAFALPSYGLPCSPQAEEHSDQTSMVDDDSSAIWGRSFQINPTQAIPHSRGAPPAAAQTGSGEERRAPDNPAVAERISSLLLRSIRDGRVDVKIVQAGNVFERRHEPPEPTTPRISV